MPNNEHKSYLRYFVRIQVLGADMDATCLPKQLGLDGEIRSGQKLNGLTFSTKGRIDQQSPLVEHLKFLLDAVEPKIHMVRKLRRKGWKFVFCCTYYTSEDDIEFVLSSDVAKRIAALGSGFDLNGYCGFNEDD